MGSEFKNKLWIIKTKIKLIKKRNSMFEYLRSSEFLQKGGLYSENIRYVIAKKRVEVHFSFKTPKKIHLSYKTLKPALKLL